MTINEPFLGQVSVGLTELQGGTVYHYSLRRALEDLDEIWNPKAPACLELRASLRKKAIAPPKRPPPWYLGWSSSFRKAVDKIDRTIQGRILEALSDIAENPVMIRGDTIKPLTGELKGCWRYRIGAFRLIYTPDQSTGNITLLAFEARGSAYDD
jgi:mRNA-degrading endonuclease RelE of RelBE toxin-antitoxin system